MRKTRLTASSPRSGPVRRRQPAFLRLDSIPVRLVADPLETRRFNEGQNLRGIPPLGEMGLRAEDRIRNLAGSPNPQNGAAAFPAGFPGRRRGERRGADRSGSRAGEMDRWRTP